MVKDPNNRGSYSEEFDMARLEELEEMAERYVQYYYLQNISVDPKNCIPDGTFSDLECNVWSLFVRCYNHGRESTVL